MATKADDLGDVLESLRPVRRELVMDLVREAGIDVAPWARTANGPSEKPQSNPNFCYEWSFGGNDEPTALCIWYDSLKRQNSIIFYEGNLREQAIELERAAEDYFKPKSEKRWAHNQAKRARMFDLLVQHAYRKSQPLRIIVVRGHRKRESLGPGIDASEVEYRLLDPEVWHVSEYREDGTCKLVRGPVEQGTAAANAAIVHGPIFADQFSLPELAERRRVVVEAYPRSPEVRRTVLERAAGICECCGAAGFKTTGGIVYLETHHVFPLAAGGPDVEWNVVAICPNDHRRAHFGEDRGLLRGRYAKYLAGRFPSMKSALDDLLSASEEVDGA